MDLILCHTTADFDTLGAAVGMARLRPGSRIVLTGGLHSGVRDFLAFYRDEYPLIELRSVNAKQIRSLTIVDASQSDRLGKAAEWLDLPVPIYVWDHHLEAELDIPATETAIEPVGATTTLIVEELLKQNGSELAANSEIANYYPANTPGDTSPYPLLTPAEATVMALAIHADTGSLTFDHTTVRDAKALAWLMEQGASLPVIAEYVEPGLSTTLQELLSTALEQLQAETVRGSTISWVLLDTKLYVPGLSTLASRLLEITESEVLLLAARYKIRREAKEGLIIIGRSRLTGTNLGKLFKPLGGGGHPRAASVGLRGVNPESVLEQLIDRLKTQIPHPPIAGELMSSPVRTIRPNTTIDEAQRILLRYGHAGLSVVDVEGKLVGIISRRDIDIALHHGFSHAPVKGYMATNLKTITPETSLPEIESLMVTYDIGRLPVLEGDRLVGIVTRTDVLRQLHQDKTVAREVAQDIAQDIAQEISLSVRGNTLAKSNPFVSATDPQQSYCPLPQSIRQILEQNLVPEQWQLLQQAARVAGERGWHLYLVGGAVRDLLLGTDSRFAPKEQRQKPKPNSPKSLFLKDIDLVVDGFHREEDAGAGVKLAKALRKLYPGARLEIHGKFQTAALLWHKDPALESLWLDIATARTEFYPYPAANPEVESSSIRQDLYRRDFTINALAVRLTGEERSGEILDFFGGLLDLRDRLLRVLHSNSFIEDPTRIYRAVRFAVRLGFEIDPQTRGYIHHAISSGVYNRVQGAKKRAPALETRLGSELKNIFQSPHWKPALKLLGSLDALRCIHPSLELDRELWRQVRLADRCLHRFDPEQTLNRAQMRLEVLIAYLDPEYRKKVAMNLQLPADSIKRLEQLAAVQEKVTAELPGCDRISELVMLLRQYDGLTLTSIAIRTPRVVRQQIWQYLARWSRVKPLLDGGDLKRLGYKPGRQFKEILDALLVATLDGEISNKTEAEVFVRQNFYRV